MEGKGSHTDFFPSFHFPSFMSYEYSDYQESYSIAAAPGGYLVSASDETLNNSEGAFLYRTDASGLTSNGSCNEISRNVSTVGGVAQVSSVVPGELTGGTSTPVQITLEASGIAPVTHCISTQMERPVSQTTAQVYPQPLTGRGRVLWSEGRVEGKCWMEVVGVAGRRFRKVIEKTGNGSGTFEAGELAPGIYSFRILDEAGNILGRGRFLRMAD